MGERISGDNVNIEYRDVSKFFDDRSANANYKSKYNYVIFQDDHPELAEQRDTSEKNKIGKLLSIKNDMRILDIGCGIGRWGEYFLRQNVTYVGIDGSAGMIQLAKENLKSSPTGTYHLYTGYAQNTAELLKQHKDAALFDIILVNGVFMYLNDDDLNRTLEDIAKLAAPQCQLYLKESMGFEKRLTLKDIHSDALKQEYSAIYRSIEEYRRLFDKYFGSTFTTAKDEPLFDEGMRNRKETLDYYFILKR